MRVDAAIECGNGLIEVAADGVVSLRPDLRDTVGGWFYWCVRVRDAGGSHVRVRLAQPSLLAALGPGVSVDGGATWSWLGAQRGDEFALDVPADCGDLRLSMGMPYGPSRLERFLARFARHPHLVRSTLCRSRKGREVPLLRLGRIDGGATRRVLLTARHHSCEMMASYAIEGLIEAILGEDELGRWFRERVEVLCVPMVDRDGVEDGDQGKGRGGRDHNRDYVGPAFYPETGALRELVTRWSNGRLDAALDLHCPWITGGRNETVYLVGSPRDEVWREQCAFGLALKAANRSPIPYEPADDLPFGQDWNVAENFKTGLSSATWFATLPGARMASTLELPYAIARGATVDQQTAVAFGHALGAALRGYVD